LGLPAHTRIWEFPLDLKIVAIAFVAWYLTRGDHGRYVNGLGLRKWNWLRICFAFSAPGGLFLVIIAIGYIMSAVEFQGVENAPTFFLSTLFDLPALFFFSATTIFVEEIIFRGVFFQTLSEKGSLLSASLLTSILWAVLRISDALDGSTALSFFALSQFMNLLSLGVVLNFLFISSSSIWVSYAFRLGVMTFSSILLSGPETDTNSLFVTESLNFASSGLTMTLLYCAVAFILTKCPNFVKNRKKI